MPWTPAPWPKIDWDRAAAPLRAVEERPAYNSTERAEKQVTKLGCLLEQANVVIDSKDDRTIAVLYKVGRGRLSLEKGYKALEEIAHAVESENQAPARRKSAVERKR